MDSPLPALAAASPIAQRHHQRRRAAERHVRAWAVLAPAGLVGVGLGASLLGEATLRKGRGETWFWPGTLALVVLNAGLCAFGDAVKHRVLADAPPEG